MDYVVYGLCGVWTVWCMDCVVYGMGGVWNGWCMDWVVSMHHTVHTPHSPYKYKNNFNWWNLDYKMLTIVVYVTLHCSCTWTAMPGY